jgi:hypothetical protein
MQRGRRAAIRQRRIEPHPIGQGNAGAAERHSEARLLRRPRETQADPRSAKRGGEPAGTESVEHRDRRQVERILQRFPRGDVALEAPIEIGGRVVGEMPGTVLEHGLRMEDQPVESHRIDERLQSRSRRPHGARHVERSSPRRRRKIRVADIGEHPPVVIVDDHGSNCSLGIERRGLAFEKRLDPLLQQRFDCRAMGRRRRVFVPQCPREMRRPERHREPQRRHILLARLSESSARDHALRRHAQEDAIAGGAGGLRMSIRPKVFRRSWNGDEQGAFRRREPRRFLPEIG